MIEDYQGHNPITGNNCYVHSSAVIIGKVKLADDVSVWPTAVLRGDVERIDVGARTNIQDASVLHVTHDGPYSPGGRALIIGDDVTVGHKVLLHACTIGNRCLIGMGAIVMDNVIIEDDVIVAAGALVTPGKQLESGYLYAGSPARQIRPLTEMQIANLKYSAEHYVRVKNSYTVST